MLWWLLGYVMIPVCEKTGTIIISLLKRARASPVGINSIYVYERGAIEPPPHQNEVITQVSYRLGSGGFYFNIKLYGYNT